MTSPAIENSGYEGMDMLKEILTGLTVPSFPPIRNDSSEHMDGVDSCRSSFQMIDMPILDMMGSNLYPFLIACNGHLKRAAIRIVQTCSWRCIYLLPILQSINHEETVPSTEQMEFMKSHGFKPLSQDLIYQIRRELNSGRLFHQGYDVDGDPVIYFRINPVTSIQQINIDVIEYSALHIIEHVLNIASSSRPSAVGGDGSPPSWSRLTLIIILEQTDKADTKPSYWDSSTFYPLRYHNLLQKLVPLFSQHYPERLKHVLVVQASSELGWWSTLLGNFGAFAYFPSSRTRSKIHFIKNLSDLGRYVSLDALLPELKFNFIESTS